MKEVAHKLGNENIEDVKSLFKEYSLISGAEVCFVSFEEELLNLKEVYSLPKSCIRVAYCGNLPVGCVGLKSINETNCEMKRLYVKAEYRNLGIGKELIESIIKTAKELGYKCLSLETIPEIMGSAIRLYRECGFKEVCNKDGILIMKIKLLE